MKDYYSIPEREVLATFDTALDTGLTGEQVQEQKVLHGRNVLPAEREDTFFERLLRQLINPLVLILVAALVLTLILQEHIDALVIAIAILVNVTVALIQEGKASEAYKLLQEKRVHKALVVRDGSKQEILLEDLVPGDIVLVQSGMYVPADIRLIEATNITANQVAFTGESVAVAKEIEPSSATHPFERSSMLFAGSTIASGSGVGIVTETGPKTEFAKIAHSLLLVQKEKSPIEKESEKIAHALSIIAGVIVVIIIGLGLYRDLGIYEMMLLAVAVAVSAVPEGLPSAITAILAYGAALIGKQGGLVKNLSSAQTLGSTDIILTDKTGTLTYGLMDISEIISLSSSPEDRVTIAEHGLFATDVFFDTEHKKFIGDDVDQAIARYFPEGGEYVNTILEQAPQQSVVPFDSRNKFFAATREWRGETTLFAKGAFSILWDQATQVLDAGEYRDKTEKDYKYFNELIEAATKDGKRALAVVHNHCAVQITPETEPKEVLQGAVFCGILVMEDAVRETAAEAVLHAQEAGVAVVMITGDAANTARSIAYQTGIVDVPDAEVVYGDDMFSHSDQDLYDHIMSGRFRIFSRVSPEHKLRLVNVLTNRGRTVAMTGDGVNDSLALSRASVGISLSSATEVAKESADIILTNNSFQGIVFALREGRRIAVNITKTIVYLLSTSFSEVVVIVSSLLIGLSIPFLPAHILWANMLGEGIMNFAFLFEPNREPQNKPRTIINKDVIKLTGTIGVVNGLMFLLLFGGLNFFGDMGEKTIQTIMFGALAFSAVFASIAMRDLARPFWRTPFTSNKFFVWAFGINLGLFVLTVGTEIGRELLHLQKFTLDQIILVAGFGLINLLLIELVKKTVWPQGESMQSEGATALANA